MRPATTRRPMFAPLNDTEAQLVNGVARALQFRDQPSPNPAVLLNGRRPLPLWFDLCRGAMAQDRFAPVGQASTLHHALTTADERFDLGSLDRRVPIPSTQKPCMPSHVARLAAHVAGLDARLAARPANLQDDLICSAFERPDVDGQPDLDLTVLLVSPWLGANDRGALARLELWRVPDALLDARPAARCTLVRSPGAAMLRIDEAFAQGLERVQALMRAVLDRGAPAVAWNVRPLGTTDEPHAACLQGLTGLSASTAFAYGTLILLGRYLRDEFGAVEGWLHDIEHPDGVAITAELAALDAAKPFRWPALVPVLGVDDKFSALDRVAPGRVVHHRYVARGQPSNARHLAAGEAEDLGRLIEHIGRDAGGLDDDARSLHRLLVHDDKPVEERNLLERIAGLEAPPRSVKAYLVQRYAQRAEGPHRAFGDPVRLDRHFVRLVLQPETVQDGEDRRPDSRNRPSVELRQLLQTAEFDVIPAWCIDAQPFSGKTTLLAQWEMITAREALQHHQQNGVWGEVCVFLPMLAFQAPGGAGAPVDPREVETAFEHFIQQRAPGLPPLADLLSGRCAALGLKLRLLVDALNEIAGADFDHRARVVETLCTWFSRHRQHLLPPVFTVRTLENGLRLASVADPAWRARRAELLPWRRSEWCAYIEQRQLKPQARDRLLQALRADLSDDASLTAFETFCATPGILAAQCTLLKRWPGMAPPRERGTLFLALLWHCLAARVDSRISEDLVPMHMRGDAAKEHAGEHRQWRLPDDPGPLIEQLARQADAMVDAAGLPRLEVSARGVPPGLSGDEARRWLQAARQLGLAVQGFGGYFAFAHQQWLEFFAALALRVDGPLPDVTAPPLVPPDEAGLIAHLAKKGARLELPAVTPHHERIRFAVSLSSDPERWIERLLPHNWALAAQVAIDAREALEPLRDSTEGHWVAPHAVLQHVRRVLLLRSVDAGSGVRERLRAGGVIAALEEPVPALPQSLQHHWSREWEAAFSGSGRDLRERLQAGLLLGELGDNLRYECMSVALPGGGTRGGVRLRRRHWIAVGTPGRQSRFRIGSDTWDCSARKSEQPAFDVHLPYFEVSAYPVTAGEMQAFVDCGGFVDPDAPWWRAAGVATQDWLRKRRAKQLDFGFEGNQLQPAKVLYDWALAYVTWASRLYHGESWNDGLSLALPTEVQWEAAVRGPRRTGTSQQRWPHPGDEARPSPLVFNHLETCWRQPSPVGVFSAGLTAHGVADAAGNVEEWCSSARPAGYNYETSFEKQQASTPAGPNDGETLFAIRGGDHGSSTSPARGNSLRTAHRSFLPATWPHGLRLVRCVQPHLGR